MINRQAKRCEKDEKAERTKLKKAIKSGNNETARLYASNAIRKRKEHVKLLELASRIEAAGSRAETVARMNGVTRLMGGVVGEIDKAMNKGMNLEKMTEIMDKFERQSDNLDVHTSYMEESINGTTAQSTPQKDVDALVQEVADEAGLELNQELGVVTAPQEPLPEEERLSEQLARLRNAS
ncbi:hypothetical protein GGF46_002620 [Coemansia sp. RSA 552]|nr:hypothetical protein GGF46_002620 [Coemansia sp. RSA 552]